MFVVGTAGHVDHGKSTLIQALTGRHPDRLAEEQDREMSIVLGFDTLELPSGKQVGIVDVPGHRDFIENMLSGIGGIDAALFVIAADEGVMPQTREHLAILDLLEVGTGVIALTKIDLVQDSEWLELVELDVIETCTGTVLEDAPLVRVSGTQDLGLEELLQALDDVLADRSPRPDLGRPRLSVDRTFTVPGFGTVVTGTLLEGSFQVGEEVILLPAGKEGRIRGLQTHNQDVQSASPGQRTAINLSGVEVEDINRGDIVAKPGHYRPSRRIDVRFRLLQDVLKPLEHNVNAKLFLGADEVFTRVRLLGKDLLGPGELGFLQLETSEPVIATRGDHYILRRPSPSETIGGGIVLDPHPEFRYRRFDSQVLDRLLALTTGDPTAVVREIIQQEGIIAREDLLRQANLKTDQVEGALQVLAEERLAGPVGDSQNGIRLIGEYQAWEERKGQLKAAMDRFYRENPLKLGISRAQLKNQADLSPEVFEAALSELAAEGELSLVGPLVKEKGRQIELTPVQEKKRMELLKAFQEQPFAPPTRETCEEMVGQDLLEALITRGEIVPVSEDVLFRTEDYHRMTEEVQGMIEKSGPVSVAEVRDHFGSSRRYVLALLEHLDAEGVTVREGDVRRLGG